MASYKLPLKSLSIGVQEFNYHLNAAFFNDIEATDVREASVDVVVKVHASGQVSRALHRRYRRTLPLPSRSNRKSHQRCAAYRRDSGRME